MAIERQVLVALSVGACAALMCRSWIVSMLSPAPKKRKLQPAPSGNAEAAEAWQGQEVERLRKAAQCSMAAQKRQQLVSPRPKQPLAYLL